MNEFNSLDDFMESVCSKDTNVRLDVYARLEEYLRDEYTTTVSPSSSDLGKFCEAILAWISSSNFRISINGLTIIQLLVQRLPEQMRNFSIEIAIIILDRVVDNKEQVRFAAKNILLFMMASYGPSYMWDKLIAGFNHKLPKVREETLDLLEETFHKFGGNNLPIAKLLTCVVKLLGDQSQQVRDKSLVTIIEMYKYTGERLRTELYKKQLPDAKLKLIIYKFDEVARKGELVNFVYTNEEAAETVSHLPPPPATSSMSHHSVKTVQKAAATATAAPVSSSSSATSLPNSKSNQSSIGSRDQPEYRSVRMPRSTSLARASASGSITNLEYTPSHQRSASSAKNDGALSESAFYEGFEGVPKINVYSASDLQDRLRKITQALSNMNPEFINVRMDAVPTLRSILVSCRANDLLDEYFVFIKQLHEPLKNQLKDLRSTMVRQVTQTVCLWAETWPDKMDVYLESWLPCFIGFLPNSAKVMSSNAVIAIRFIYQNVRSTRLLPCLLESLSHKNPMVRRHMIENLTLIVTGWGIELIDKYSKQMIAGIVKLVTDPEVTTREHARETFWEFYKLYPELAKSSVAKLDGKVKAVLEDHSTEVIGHKVMLDQGGGGVSRTTTRPPPVSASASATSLKRSTSAVDLKNNSLSRSNSIVSKAAKKKPSDEEESDLLAQSVLDDLDLLKSTSNDIYDDIDDAEYTFDLASKSQLLFMASNNINSIDQQVSTTTNNTTTTSSRNNSFSTSNKLTTGSRIPVTNYTTNTTPRYLNNTPSRIPTSTNPSPNKSRIAQSQPGSRSTSPTPKYSYLTHFTSNPANQSQLDSHTQQQQQQRLLDMSNSAFNGYYFNDITDSVGGNGGGSVTNTPSVTSSNKQAIVSRYNQHFMNSASRSGGAAAASVGGGKATNRLAASSRNSSRESSPGRRSSYSERRISIGKTSTPGRNLFQINRQMSNTPDCEKVFSKKQFTRGRRWPEDSDEASETSSICSERSFSSSIGGTRITEDINEAIALLSSTQWSERRDGLENIKKMMQNGRVFTRQEIKRLRDVFLRLFSDQHTKVFSIFLDTLNMFITVYREHLADWLFVLLTRLLIKQGGENLSTVNKKILACLDTVRTSFTIELQFKTLITFIKDSSIQQSNFKVKIAVLSYLQVLLLTMKSSDLHASEDLRQALIRIVGLSGEPKSFELRKSAQSVLIALYNLNAPECAYLFGQLPQDLHATAIKVVKDHMKTLRMEDEAAMMLLAKSGGSPKQVLSAFNLDYMSKTTSYLNDYVNNLNNNGDTDSQTISSGGSSSGGGGGLQLSHVIKDIQNLSMHSNYHASSYVVKETRHGAMNTNAVGSSVNGVGGGGKNDEILSKDSGVQSNGDVDSDSDGAVSSTTSHSTINLPDMATILAKLESPASLGPADKIRAMRELTELIKTGNRPEYKWSENFNKVLACLLNYLDTTMGIVENAHDQQLAMQTLYAMQELLQFHYKDFNTYIELTVRKLIDRYRDSPPSEHTKLVEEVIYTAARCLPAEPCVNYLRPVIETGDYPKNLMSIKMMQKCIQHMSVDVCKRLMGDMIRSLLISWDNKESPVRRQSVLCIVDIYLVAGDSLKDHLTQLSSSKMKLLNVYINRRFEENTTSNVLMTRQQQQQQIV